MLGRTPMKVLWNTLYLTLDMPGVQSGSLTWPSSCIIYASVDHVTVIWAS